MKNLKIFILIGFMIIGMLVLTGCSLDYGELKGIVINKKYTPNRVHVQPIYTGKTMMVVPINHSEKWEIQIQKEESRRNKNNLG